MLEERKKEQEHIKFQKQAYDLKLEYLKVKNETFKNQERRLELEDLILNGNQEKKLEKEALAILEEKKRFREAQDMRQKIENLRSQLAEEYRGEDLERIQASLNESLKRLRERMEESQNQINE